MNNLFAPWRSKYSDDVTSGKQEGTNPDVCVFCTQLSQNQDEKYFILKRFDHSFVMLNKYPYNAGHLLIIPNEHVPSLTQLSKEARMELMELQTQAIGILTDTLKCQGLNIGINLGKTGGAGIPSHIHIHVLPRWQGDTNFMATIAKTRVISYDMQKIYEELKTELSKIKL